MSRLWLSWFFGSIREHSPGICHSNCGCRSGAPRYDPVLLRTISVGGFFLLLVLNEATNKVGGKEGETYKSEKAQIQLFWKSGAVAEIAK